MPVTLAGQSNLITQRSKPAKIRLQANDTDILISISFAAMLSAA
jgi:hypothetical protein